MPAREGVVFVAAHPDDEVVGAGAQIERGATVVHVTDGAPRDSADARALGFATREEYAAARRREAAEALPGVRIVALNFVDQEATLALAAVARALAETLETLGATLVYGHPYEGGHPDHDAAAFALHAARALVRRAPALAEFTSYHAGSGGAPRSGVFLSPNAAALAPGPEVVMPLAGAALARKRRRVAAYASQSRVLAGFPLDAERFRRAPLYTFTRAPHRGALHYERFSWGMTGARWRELARAALAELRLDEPL
jgi:LmbE family N-acetylglucosaminyl deacetylase